MPKIIISDTSTLILFQKIGELGLLQKVYTELTTTPEVAEEFGETLPGRINIQAASDKRYQDFLETQVDCGEASAIALAAEFEEVLLYLMTSRLENWQFYSSLRLQVLLELFIKPNKCKLSKK